MVSVSIWDVKMFIQTFYLFVNAAVWHRFGCSLFHKSEEIRQIRNAVNIFNPILSAFMSSLHVLEKLSLNIGHLSCIYYPFLACKRLVSVLLKIEIDQIEKRKLNQSPNWAKLMEQNRNRGTSFQPWFTRQ